MFDVVIVGGGAMGSSIAWHLTMEPTVANKVAVVERDPTYALRHRISAPRAQLAVR